jgi:hypothetical protein
MLVVSDGQGRSASDSLTLSTTSDRAPTVSITANPSNPTPGTTVTLAGQVTSFADQAVSYAWSLVSAPAESTAQLSSTTAATPTLVPEIAGSYTLSLQVTDAAGLPSALATATLAVAAFTAPGIVALTASPAVVLPGGTTTVQAIVNSTDGFSPVFSWSAPAGWTVHGTTVGGSLTLVAPTAYNQLGQVGLSVNDGHGASTSAVAIVATTADVAPSVQSTASPTNPYFGSTVTLIPQVVSNGAQQVTYAWSLIAVPSGASLPPSYRTWLVPTWRRS